LGAATINVLNNLINVATVSGPHYDAATQVEIDTEAFTLAGNEEVGDIL